VASLNNGNSDLSGAMLVSALKKYSLHPKPHTETAILWAVTPECDEFPAL